MISITIKQILEIGKLFANIALNFDEYSLQKLKFPNLDSGVYRISGNVKLDRIDTDIIQLYWDICENYIIVAIRKTDISFSHTSIAKFVVNANYPKDFPESSEYFKYKEIFDVFVEIVNNVLTNRILT